MINLAKLSVSIVATTAIWLSTSTINPAFADKPASSALANMKSAPIAMTPPHAKSGMNVVATLSPDALKQERLSFNVFDGRTLTAKRAQIVTEDTGTSWIGEIEGAPGSMAIISNRDGIVTGFIDDGRDIFEIRSTPSGEILLYQVDTDALPTAEDEPLPPTGIGSTLVRGPSSDAIADGPVVQTILLAYTPLSRNYYFGGSHAAVEGALRDAVNVANVSYAISGVNIQLQVALVTEVDYIEALDMGTTLDQLRTKNDGQLDEIHSLRDQYQADLVALFSYATGNVCGIANISVVDGVGYEQSAFSVTRPDCLSNATFEHEIGHNQGNCHDRQIHGGACQGPAQPYSYGYCASQFRTIMAYGTFCPTNRHRYFSNPDLVHLGEPAGVSHDVNPYYSADNAQSMNRSAQLVACYRGCEVEAPQNLSASASSTTEVQLSWIDSDGEVGYAIQRSMGNGAFSSIALLAKNTSSFRDVGLNPNTTYRYRIIAFDDFSEAVSNSTSVTTMGPPTPAPSGSGSGGGGSTGVASLLATLLILGRRKWHGNKA